MFTFIRPAEAMPAPTQQAIQSRQHEAEQVLQELFPPIPPTTRPAPQQTDTSNHCNDEYISERETHQNRQVLHTHMRENCGWGRVRGHVGKADGRFMLDESGNKQCIDKTQNAIPVREIARQPIRSNPRRDFMNPHNFARFVSGEETSPDSVG